MNHIEDLDIRTLQNTHSINDYQEAATKSAIYPGKDTALGLMYCALKLNGEAGELAEHIGKALRDDNFGAYQELTPERKEHIIKEVGDVAWYLSAICNELNIDFATALVVNLRKLKDRQERNVQRGSGDDR